MREIPTCIPFVPRVLLCAMAFVVAACSRQTPGIDDLRAVCGVRAEAFLTSHVLLPMWQGKFLGGEGTTRLLLASGKILDQKVVATPRGCLLVPRKQAFAIAHERKQGAESVGFVVSSKDVSDDIVKVPLKPVNDAGLFERCGVLEDPAPGYLAVRGPRGEFILGDVLRVRVGSRPLATTPFGCIAKDLLGAGALVSAPGKGAGYASDEILRSSDILELDAEVPEAFVETCKAMPSFSIRWPQRN